MASGRMSCHIHNDDSRFLDASTCLCKSLTCTTNRGDMAIKPELLTWHKGGRQPSPLSRDFCLVDTNAAKTSQLSGWVLAEWDSDKQDNNLAQLWALAFFLLFKLSDPNVVMKSVFRMFKETNK